MNSAPNRSVLIAVLVLLALAGLAAVSISHMNAAAAGHKPELNSSRQAIDPCTITCPANITVSNDPNQCGAVVNYPAPTTSGVCGAVICSPATGAFFPVGTTTVNCFINDCATAFAVDTENNLISFALSAPGTILSSVPIGGLLAGDQIHGIDFRPATGQLYGLGVNLMTETAHLYTINATTGAATQVGGDIAVTGGDFPSYGFDFNPTVDRIRVTSNEDLNLRLHPDTGAVSLDTNINPPGATVTGLAYTNNFAGATQTTLYGLNVASPGDSLGIVGGVNGVPSPNGGTFTTVGLLGVDAITFTGFDISRCDGTAYAALGVSDNYALYTIDLGTGAVTQVGTIGTGGQVNAMALAPSSASCSFTITVIDTQPPTITCPDNVTAVAAQTCPISSSATVTFPAPTVSDNCPGVTSVCNPPIGSTFTVGTTTVTCTATDTSGNTASCSFTVTVFSGCLQDDSNPAKVVLFNVATGEYRFCCGGAVFTGVGTVLVKGCTVTIQHYPVDRRVLIKFDGAVGAGSASLQSPPGSIRCTIRDRNTKNNTCACEVAP